MTYRTFAMKSHIKEKMNLPYQLGSGYEMGLYNARTHELSPTENSNLQQRHEDRQKGPDPR